ncbi:MAG TPA: cell division protein FtsZ, partial [Cellulomonas sp.]|nr:cell division protein FtsZ [Cellulomonas sp.]
RQAQPQSRPDELTAPIPASVPVAQPDVPAFLSTEAEPVPITGALEVPRIFSEDAPRRERDELDVPDFLK